MLFFENIPFLDFGVVHNRLFVQNLRSIGLCDVFVYLHFEDPDVIPKSIIQSFLQLIAIFIFLDKLFSYKPLQLRNYVMIELEFLHIKNQLNKCPMTDFLFHFVLKH